MHSATQIIAQRAPPATRTKARWQPYYSIPSASSSSASLPPRSPYINTPNASVSPSLAPQPSTCDLNRSRPSLSATTTQTPKESSQRDSTTKHKFAVGLIDQAVNTLSEIWRPQDIPRVFQAPPKATPPFTASQSNVLSPPKQQNITSRISPHPSPVSLHPQLSRPSAISKQIEIDQQKVDTQALLASGTDPDQSLLPIKTFVHEVLRRSRTSGSILQAALCYLEAIRPKVSEILREEKMGIRAHYLPDSTILPATPEELEREAELCAMDDSSSSQIFDDSVKTVRVTDCGGPEDFDAMHQLDDGNVSISSLVAEPSAPSATSSLALPSPLLCPRRAFLASLILASKFFQDKCYSNRAWAKLSGLPPREIGRCERALGQALEWRLWVGKNPVAPQPTVTATPPIRTIVRSQTESSILSTSTSNRPFLSQDEIGNRNHQEFTQDKQRAAPSLRSGLRRCSTVPDNVFAARATSSCEMTRFPSGASDRGQDQDQDMDDIFENGKQEPPSTTSSSDSEKSSSSPSPETPGLTYSPSSTECSFGGDRTIQMSTFEDNMLPSVNGSKLWLDNVDPRCGAIRTSSPVPQIKGDYEYDNNAFIFDFARLHAKTKMVSVVESETGSCGTHYLWREDSHYIPLEAAGVH